MKHLIILFCISALVVGCGIKRPLRLPDPEKKHTADTVPDNTTTQSPQVIPAAPAQ